MTTTFLAYFPSPPQGVWHLGPLPIRAYAVFIIVGIVVALLVGDRRWEARGGERGVIYDIALWAVPFGLIGGRLYHLSTDWRTYFGEGGAGLSAALRIWDGGLGIWGAVALGGVGAWIGCRRRGIPLPAFGDAVAPGIVLAQAIGRLGNYFNQELFGRETTMPWGLEIFYRRDPSGFVDVHSLDGVSTGQLAMVVQPTFLYELLWNILIFVLLIYLDRRFTIGHGRLFALYVAGYCVGRFVIELLRDDTATHIAGIRINSFTSTFVFIGAVVYIILAPKGREDPTTLGGSRQAPEKEPVPEPASELAAVAAASGAAAAAPAAGRADDVGVEPGGSAETKADQPEAEAVAAETEAVEGDAAEVEVMPVEGDESGAEEPEAEPVAEAEPEAEVVERPEGEAEVVAAAEAVEAEPGVETEPVAEKVGATDDGGSVPKRSTEEPLAQVPTRGLRGWRSRLRDLRSRTRLVGGGESGAEVPEVEPVAEAKPQQEVPEAELPERETKVVAPELESAEGEVPEDEVVPAEGVESVADELERAEPVVEAEPEPEVPEAERPEGEAEAVAAQAESAEAESAEVEVPEGEAVPAEAAESVAEELESAEPEAEPVTEKVGATDDGGGVAKRSTAEPLAEVPARGLRRWRSGLRDLRSRTRLVGGGESGAEVPEAEPVAEAEPEPEVPGAEPPEGAAEVVAAEAESAEPEVPEGGVVPAEEVVGEPESEPEPEVPEAEPPEGAAEVVAEAESAEAEVPEGEVVPAEAAESVGEELESAEPEAEPAEPGAGPEPEVPEGEQPEAEVESAEPEVPEGEVVPAEAAESVGEELESAEPEAEPEPEVPEAEQPEAEVESAGAEVPEGEVVPAEALESLAEEPEPVEPGAEPAEPEVEPVAEPVAEEVQSTHEGGVAKGSTTEPLGEEPTTRLRRWTSRLRDLRSRTRR